MWTYDKDDELRNKIKYDITMWYRHWYMGTDEMLMEHLRLFDVHYDPRLFDDEDTRDEAIKVFLTFLQGEVEKVQID